MRPNHSAAVVGGNVETSQRITDVLLGALGLSGASQGTMNNFLFGKTDGSGKQYYETIAGGSGACDGNHGASAVQVGSAHFADPKVSGRILRDLEKWCRKHGVNSVRSLTGAAHE